MIILPDSRPSDLVYALLSQQAYQVNHSCSEKAILPEPIIPEFPEWRILDIKVKARYPTVIYINDTDKQIVVAYRDFSPSSSWKEMFDSISLTLSMFYLKNFNSGAITELYSVLNKVVEMIKSDLLLRGYQLSFTGHSLGGFLAEISVFLCHSKLDYITVSAVVFESPGTLEILQNLQGTNTISLEVLDIITYLTYPNIINTTNLHVGTVYHLPIVISSKIGLLSLQYTLEAFRLGGIIQALQEKSHPRWLVYEWLKRRSTFEYNPLNDMEYDSIEKRYIFKKNHINFRIDVEKGKDCYLPLRNFFPSLQKFLKKLYVKNSKFLLQEDHKEKLESSLRKLGVPFEITKYLLNSSLLKEGRYYFINTSQANCNADFFRYILSSYLAKFPNLYNDLKSTCIVSNTSFREVNSRQSDDLLVIEEQGTTSSNDSQQQLSPQIQSFLKDGIFNIIKLDSFNDLKRAFVEYEKNLTSLNISKLRDENGETVLTLAILSKKDDLLKIKYLVALDKRLLNSANDFGNTALHVAAKLGKHQIIEYFLKEEEMDACLVFKQNKSKDTAVSYALMEHQYNIAMLLIEALSASQINKLISIEKNNNTLLHELLKRNRKEANDILLNLFKYEIDKKVIERHNNFGMSPLYCAIYSNNEEGALFLIENGASITTVISNDALIILPSNADNRHSLCFPGATVLHCARKEILLMLLNKHLDKLNINDSNNIYRCTPLHNAVMAMDILKVKTLIDKGANVTLVDHEEMTCLHLAVVNSSREILGLDKLMSFLVELHPQLLTAQDKYGMTVLHWAIIKGGLFVELLLPLAEKFGLLEEILEKKGKDSKVPAVGKVYDVLEKTALEFAQGFDHHHRSQSVTIILEFKSKLAGNYKTRNEKRRISQFDNESEKKNGMLPNEENNLGNNRRYLFSLAKSNNPMPRALSLPQPLVKNTYIFNQSAVSINGGKADCHVSSGSTTSETQSRANETYDINNKGDATMPRQCKKPSYFEYSVMSDYGYLDTNEAAEGKLLERLGGGWQVIKCAPDKLESGYVGAIFIHKERKQIVIAHAGTLPSRYKTLLADVRGILGAQTDPLLLDALMQSQGIQQATLKSLVINEGYNLSFTGHSLGGFLAEMSVYACHRGFGLDYPEASAVVFDSPGSLEIMQVWESHIGQHQLDLKQLNIISFLSSPNLVNTLNSHPGTVYRLLRDLSISTFQAYLLESHDRKKLFSLFDAETGLPDKHHCIEMEDWPLADYEELLSLKDHFVSGVADLAVSKTLDFISNMGRSLLDYFKGSPKKVSLMRLFGGDEPRQLWELFNSQQPSNYHLRFDTTSVSGLGEAINTHYIVKKRTPELSIVNMLPLVNVKPRVLAFLDFHGLYKEDALYQPFLQDKTIQLELPTYCIDWRQGIIYLTDKIEGTTIFALLDGLESSLSAAEMANWGKTYLRYVQTCIHTLGSSHQESKTALSEAKNKLAQLEKQLTVLSAKAVEKYSIWGAASAIVTENDAHAETYNKNITAQAIIDMASSIPLDKLKEDGRAWIISTASAVTTTPGGRAVVHNDFSTPAAPMTPPQIAPCNRAPANAHFKKAPKEKIQRREFASFDGKPIVRESDGVKHYRVDISYFMMGKIIETQLQQFLVNSVLNSEDYKGIVLGSSKNQKKLINSIDFEEKEAAAEAVKEINKEIYRLQDNQAQAEVTPSTRDFVFPQ